MQPSHAEYLLAVPAEQREPQAHCTEAATGERHNWLLIWPPAGTWEGATMEVRTKQEAEALVARGARKLGNKPGRWVKVGANCWWQQDGRYGQCCVLLVRIGRQHALRGRKWLGKLGHRTAPEAAL